MAGDWIKVEHATLDKPEVVRLADLLGIPPDQAVGLLVRFWVWVDQNMRNDSVTLMYAKSLDTVTHCSGFSSALVDVGWAKVNENTGLLSLPNIARHNGSPAKTRALTKDRVKRSRNAVVNDYVTQTALPEKRREENNNNIVSPQPLVSGFDMFWSTWPKRKRKVAKWKCLQFWKAKNLESSAAAIVAHVKAMAVTTQWIDYDPAPLTYLNQRRWLDDLQPDDDKAKKVAM